MERLTKRIASHVYYTQGKYEETIPAEMETNDIRNVLKKLAEYEDAEEQGLLLRLPCKVGDTLWWTTVFGDLCSSKVKGMFIEHGIDGIVIETLVFDINEKEIGKTVFLTRTEAEQALAEMEKEK